MAVSSGEMKHAVARVSQMSALVVAWRIRLVCRVDHSTLASSQGTFVLTIIFYYRSDYINPIDLCNRLNTYIVPEAAIHGFLTALFLINGYWMALILNLPLAAWNAKK